MRRLAPFLLSAVLGACAGLKAGDVPRLSVGQDACAKCGMIVSDDRFAAGYVSDEGESVVFDDLGELLAELQERPGLRSRAWARDMKGGGWARLTEAETRRSERLATPMGTGWAAFARKSDAEAFARSGR